jgi:hypothetical protein
VCSIEGAMVFPAPVASEDSRPYAPMRHIRHGDRDEAPIDEMVREDA